MHRYCAAIVALLICCACKPSAQAPVQPEVATSARSEATLAAARSGFKTRIVTVLERKFAAPTPPPGVFNLIRYRSPVGELPAHLTRDPGDGKLHPAIVWIAGGDCNSIGQSWIEGPPSDEQSAAAYRRAGIVMMFPALRGGNDSPVPREGFYGEVDDVLAAADYLAALPYVDPRRIYLGGHSTGGTLTMLVTELSDRFRAAFAFGPVSDVLAYGGPFVYHDPADTKEAELRAPGRWLASVRTPLFVFEGTRGNLDELELMRERNTNPLIQFYPIAGKDHFDVLAPLNQLIAAKILADSGAARITISAAELAAAAKN